jgi:hypothetical protein
MCSSAETSAPSLRLIELLGIAEQHYISRSLRCSKYICERHLTGLVFDRPSA